MAPASPQSPINGTHTLPGANSSVLPVLCSNHTQPLSECGDYIQNLSNRCWWQPNIFSSSRSMQPKSSLSGNADMPRHYIHIRCTLQQLKPKTLIKPGTQQTQRPPLHLHKYLVSHHRADLNIPPAPAKTLGAHHTADLETTSAPATSRGLL